IAVAAGWFWNTASGPISAASVDRYEASGPVPFALVAVVGVLVVVGWATVVVRLWAPTGVSSRTP
ncbi:hypothetical protein, partial [Curtobacterium sp. B18]|uniref:hypothetical protein n=1 Tax=Curtobacterium sp. B18 TaxID=95614 RepID=UPI0004CE191B